MQAELFEVAGSGLGASRVSRVQTSWLSQVQVTLRIDHLLIGGILALVLYVLIFSFGVEQGKRYASVEVRAEKAKAAPAAQAETASSVRSIQEATAPASIPVPAQPLLPADITTAPIAGKYTIQLITFVSRPRAEEEIERLKKKGFEAFIIPQGRFFQVCAERFQSAKEAEKRLTELRTGGFAPSDAYIRPLKGLVGV